MKTQWRVVAKWAVVTVLCAAGGAYAGNEHGSNEQGSDGGRERGRDGGPGGERFMARAAEACAGKQAGDNVTLIGRGGESLEAVCTQRPAVLLAVPKVHLQRMEQAKAACSGLTEGAAAVLSTPDGRNIAARCESHDGELVAVPNERPAKRERR